MAEIDKNAVNTKVTADIVSKIIWAAIAPGITALVALVLSIFKKSSIAIVISIISLLFSITALIIAILFSRRKSENESDKNSDNDRGRIEPKFKASTIEAEFYFASREEMESRIEYDMQPTCSAMREYPRNLLWSGSEYKGTTIAHEYTEDYEIEEQIGPQSPHDYIIKFKNEKQIGDPVKFKTITKVGDIDHIMKEYYSYTILYQVDRLILRVSAPKGLIKNVNAAVYADRGREILVEGPTAIRKKIVGDLEEYTFDCEHPTLLYNYFIEWRFTKS